MPALAPADFARICALLKKAVDFNELESLVFLATGDRLFVDYVAPSLPLRVTIEKLIEALERDGTTERLAQQVYWAKPFQSELREVLLALYPDIGPAARKPSPTFDVQARGQSQPAFAGGEPGLQRIVKPALKQIDLKLWLDRYNAIARQVCRIEADDAPLGTGFLVASDLVLTNWHVVDEARKRGAEKRMGCRFDYNRRPDGTADAGTLVPVTAVLDESKCSPAELTPAPEQPPPKADELDYALMEVAAPANGRGYIALRAAPPVAADDPLGLVQHQEGLSLKFALDTEAVIGLSANGLRLRYRTNTLPGSSGSPCFSMDLDLVALHHLGDPSWGASNYNQGIPIDRVRASLAARGFANRLGL